jgi:predicted dehydrogenase
MPNLRFATFGAGFWARFQLAGWHELDGLECVAICDPNRAKAEALAQHFGIPAVYDSPEALLDGESLDFVDIVTPVETHAPLARMAAERGVNVVCQKPMAATFAEAQAMVQACRDAGVTLLINENWRWQHPIRQFKRILGEGRIGRVFRARIHYCNSFPVFVNQPFLKELDKFILIDMGTHLLDAARYLFGDAARLYCQTTRVHPDIKGEDVATVMMQMSDNVSVTVEMSYASRTEIERFPQTYLYVEGDQGFLELAPDYTIRETTAEGTLVRCFPPTHYPWADPDYDLVHASIVAAQANLLAHLKGEATAETTGDDNLKTLALVFAAYQSARTGQAISISS